MTDITPKRVKELFEALRAQLVYALEHPEEALFKEVWEKCRNETETEIVDLMTADFASKLRAFEIDVLHLPAAAAAAQQN